MVSIILPTYNGDKYIKESIQSIINQTYSDWELIVIDDCSTDDTNSIVAEYAMKDGRIKLYKNEQNLRLPASLNKGFAKATGEYLTWTSDDNVFLPNAIETLLGVLQSKIEYGLVFSRMEYIDAEGKKTGLTEVPENEKEIFYHNIVGASFMYTREVYEKIGEYNIQKFLLEDYDYWLRIAKVADVKYIPEVLYQYRQHAGSLTETMNRQVLEGKVELLKEQLCLSEIDDKTLRMIYKELAEALFSLDRYEEMRVYLGKMRSISSNLCDVRMATRISYIVGPQLSIIMKKLLKKKK